VACNNPGPAPGFLLSIAPGKTKKQEGIQTARRVNLKAQRASVRVHVGWRAARAYFMSAESLTVKNPDASPPPSNDLPAVQKYFAANQSGGLTAPFAASRNKIMSSATKRFWERQKQRRRGRKIKSTGDELFFKQSPLSCGFYRPKTGIVS
jgi:hypothetical protein